MATSTQYDYVLGTHDAERERLELQHRLWLDEARRAWESAGIRAGSHVLDLGCGPGLATESLLQLVGFNGRVDGVELSTSYAAQARARCAAAGRPGTVIHEIDLMSSELPAATDGAFDAAWCRWLAMFVREPARIVAAASKALRPGGCVAFHEYVDYHTYTLCPEGPRIREFVQFATASFERAGGDAHVARRLPGLLIDAGFELVSLRPIARVGRPEDPLWEWPASFARTYAPRLVELGYVDAAWSAALLAEIESARGSPGSFFVAPTVLEIVAQKR